MKKLLLSIILLFAMTALFSQTVPRTMVALEIGTGTWCQYCPGAAMGADDLLSNGKFVSVIENHNGDSYANTYSNARNTYYNITGYPTATFDGIINVVGGSHTQSMYGTYLSRYNQRINTPAHMTLDMDVTHTGNNYTAVITVTKIGSITATDLKLLFFVTQSHINVLWQGQTHLEHVNRLMVPDQNGTAVSFTSGDVQTYTLNWTMNSAWPIEDCEFIPFVQSTGTKEVFNCIKRAAVDLLVDYTASSTHVTKGDSVTFTNNTTGGYIGVPETYEWILPGTDIYSSTDKNPVVTYTEVGFFDVTLIVNRGGQIDTVVKPAYIQVDAPVGMNNKTKDVSIFVYPSPNNGSFKLELNAQHKGVYNLKVVNTLNTVVYEESNIQLQGKLVKNFNISNLSSGTYFVILQNGKNKSLEKFIVE